jgi:HEAT repeat protein
MVHGDASDRGDYRSGNRAFDQKMAALRSLRELPDRGRSSLLALLDHHHANVRLSAATHLLPTDEEKAIAVLVALTEDPSMRGFSAKMVLKEWRAGRLKVP